MSSSDRHTVLVVEDDPVATDLYDAMLPERYEVEVVHDGKTAIETIDETIDVVVVDRMLPGVSALEVVDAVRDRGLDCRIALLTAIAPDFDVIENGFDAYLEKPVSAEQLRRTVEGLAELDSYDEAVREYYSLLWNRAAVQPASSVERLEDGEDVDDVERRIEALREEFDANADRLRDDGTFVSALRSVTDDRGEEPE